MTRKKKCLRIVIFAVLFAFMAYISVCAASETADDVIMGKDGWLFYTGDNIPEDYAGTDLFTDEQLNDIRSRLRRIKGYCDESGIDFVIFIVPNKERVYSEYMPDEYGQPASYTRVEQLVDCFGDEFCVVTPLNSLYAAKQSMPGYNYYYKTDTHWNELGSYIGAKDLLSAAGYSLPDLSVLNVDSLEVPGKDLARMLDTEFITLDIQYTPTGYGPYTTAEEDQDDTLTDIHYYTEGAPSRNMTIMGDSYALAMAPYLGQEFENVFIHRAAGFSKSQLEKEQPDVLVCEMLERLFDYFTVIDLIE